MYAEDTRRFEVHSGSGWLFERGITLDRAAETLAPYDDDAFDHVDELLVGGAVETHDDTRGIIVSRVR